MSSTPKILRFQDLKVWQKAHRFAISVYQHSQQFPLAERYGLTNQLRRACVSISCNIAEGSKRQTTTDLCRFLNIAQRSNEEVKSLLLLTRDLGYLTEHPATDLLQQSEEVGAMLHGLMRSLRSSDH